VQFNREVLVVVNPFFPPVWFKSPSHKTKQIKKIIREGVTTTGYAKSKRLSNGSESETEPLASN